MRPRRPGLCRIALAAALALAWPSFAGARQQSLEYPVKAAFLYKFGSYVEWPPSAFASPTAPLQVCVIGRDPFGPLLDRTVRGQTIGARPVQVRRLAVATPHTSCHIAYLGGSAGQPIADAARVLAGEPVLTVADGPPFADAVAVNFVIVSNRVRFEISQRAAGDNGLTISSKLLNLAVSVAR